MRNFDPAKSFGPRVAAAYDDHLRGDEAETVDFLASQARGGPVLELAIGTGRIGLPLAQRELPVTGIEISEAMVAQLRRKPGGIEIPVTIGDYADLPVEGEFRLIFVVYNTIYNLLTQDDQVRCFDNVAKHLTSDGVFVIEAGMPTDYLCTRNKQYVDAERVELDEVTLDVALIMTVIAEKITAKQLGNYDRSQMEALTDGDADPAIAEKPELEPAAESRGMRWALFALLGGIVVIALLTAPSGAPLRDPVNGDIIGNTPFMDSLIFIITLLFLAMGLGFGYGAGTFKSSNDPIAGVTKAFAGLAGLIFMLLMISQFIALFNWSNMPTVIAGKLAHWLEGAGFSEIPLLIGFILVICLLDIIMPGSLPKWAIFAPVFVPLFMQLGVAPQTVLAAYRIGDSPMNVITPLMVYLPFILLIAQRYVKDPGIGTIISLMIPYTLILLLAWVIFFVVWYVIGIPLGPGYSVGT